MHKPDYSAGVSVRGYTRSGYRAVFHYSVRQVGSSAPPHTGDDSARVSEHRVFAYRVDNAVFNFYVPDIYDHLRRICKYAYRAADVQVVDVAAVDVAIRLPRSVYVFYRRAV